MLDIVGHPVATNPDTELRKIAEERGWEILRFTKPVAIGDTPLETKEGRRAAAVGIGAAVALGLAWYAGRRSAGGAPL